MALVYGNTSGLSNVDKYDLGPDWIQVIFMDGSTYEYTYKSAGKSNVEFMKRLAAHGFGLNGYVNKHVRKLYARKW